MSVGRAIDFIKGMPYARESSDGSNIMVRCPFCGDSDKNPESTHLSIRIGVSDKEPILYQCFQPEYKCGAKGILTTDSLQKLGCMDMDTILELAKHNAGVSKKLNNGFNPKRQRTYAMVNLDNKVNRNKVQYINQRLGTDMNPTDLRNFRIQLTLHDWVKLNRITTFPFPDRFCRTLDTCCIGFMSMYSDYIIFRDFSDDPKIGTSKKPLTGRRYTMYRTSGKLDPDDMKLYSLPTELDLLDPDPAVINIAEGPFSILGAYIHTDLGRDERNSLFLANCGTGYRQTIDHVCRQFGFLKVRINIYSDSEVPVSTYEKLYKQIKDRYLIESFIVYYNDKAEDFGHRKERIKVRKVTIS